MIYFLCFAVGIVVEIVASLTRFWIFEGLVARAVTRRLSANVV
ncbi:MAG: hypothetical protein M5R36_22570 [Deltaproteobacteria bacterium]|nr:hypothetical protein [Deltaproteobacteria bacterium]